MKPGWIGMIVAGALLAPQFTAASERAGAAPQAGSAALAQSAGWETLWRAPEFQGVPWLGVLSKTTVTRKDLMAGPKVDTLEPFLLPAASPPVRFRASSRLEPMVAIE